MKRKEIREQIEKRIHSSGSNIILLKDTRGGREEVAYEHGLLM